ncbi:MAG: protoporphyrinogen oxidase HemJ [Xanthomonadales bacterium]|nr:protoporphyrinogen oxidase HemJ [Gammaproteobacteria bacterium]NNE04254.1 protoporphyrinogen oxidase HemJ [Xanthomonadales bacterium]NNL94846.1 protoporphyrinogen oxidase HemJ [Xanthomonadales bacterium]
MLWLKSFHVIFMVTWFAGLFYLPRLFVYHAMSGSAEVQATLKIMQRKLMIMTHLGGGLTWFFGVLLLVQAPAWLGQGWFHAKLALVLLLTAYHFYCARLVRLFASDKNIRTHTWYRWFNELPTLALVGVVILVVVKPF